MKKYLLSFACMYFMVANSANAQRRLVLYEEFNGPCTEAAIENPVLDALMSGGTNPEHICMIKYYVAGGDPLYLMTAENDTVRSKYYGIFGMPIGRMDGAVTTPLATYPGLPGYLTQADLDDAAAVPSPFQMSVKSVVHSLGDSITVTVKVKAIAAYAPPEGVIKLRVARIKSIVFSPAWADGQTNIVNSVRNMYPDANGIAISGTWAIGDSQTYVVKGPVLRESNWLNTIHAYDSSVVAWIQNDNDRMVAQAAKEGLNISVSVPVVDKHLQNISSVLLTPNPAQEYTSVFFNANDAGTLSIDILDIAGRNVYSSPVNTYREGRNNIAVKATLAAGLYVLKLQTNAGEKHTQILCVKK